MEYITILLFMVVAGAAYGLFALRHNLALGYTSAVLLVIVGTVIFVQGVEVPHGDVKTQDLSESVDSNVTTITGTVSTETQYQTVDPVFSRALGLALLYTGLHLFYSVRNDNNG